MKEIRKIIQYVRPYKTWAILSLVTLLMMVAADLSIPRLVEEIIDQGVKQKNMNVVIHTSVIMLVISLVNTVVAVLNNIFSVRTGESVARDLRRDLFEKIQKLSYGDLDRYSTGKLMVRLTSDTAAIQRFVQVTLRIGTRAPLMMVGSLVLMFTTSARLAVDIVPVLIVTAIVIILFSIKMEPLFFTVQQKLDWLNSVLQENISGARLVKAFDRGDYEASRFEESNEAYTTNSVHVMQWMSSMSPVFDYLCEYWIGGHSLVRGATIHPG